MVTAASIGALAIGCGSDDQALPAPPVPGGPPKERIAQTVNAMFDAWNRGEGEVACAYMTPRGQRLAVRIVAQLHPLEQEIVAASCVEGVAESAAAIDEPIGQVVTPRAVSTDGRRGSVASEFRGALAVRRIDGVWLVDVPTFID